MEMEIDPATSTAAGSSAQLQPEKPKVTGLTRLCHGRPEHHYMYLTIEMEPSDRAKPASPYQLSILTFRKILSSAVQDLFGTAMGGGINIDILGFWTDLEKDPFNRMTSAASTGTDLPIVSVASTYSPLTTASAVLRSHALDFNQLWNALTLFNAMVDDYDARFEIRYVSSTLLGLQANSRQLKWPN
ncbi:hypothetical protein BGX31_009821 [Mortierella sp. GBA43]|nr:hypothetical protein BGX31_009821 [Mortierella sp. GBA43]